MTEQRIERQPRNHTVRNAGILGTGAVALLLGVASLGGALRGEPTRAESSYSPSPYPTELATQRPSEAGASPSPETSGSPEVAIQTFVVEKLGTFEVQPGDFIAGDISMSDTKESAIFPLYDQDTLKAADVQDNTKTALYVDVQAPGVIHAEWGAYVTRGLTPEKKAETLKLQAISKERAGFEKIDVVIWTGYDTTVDQAGYKADKTPGSVPSNTTENGTGYNLEGVDNQSKIRLILNLFATGKVDADSAEGKALLDVLADCFCGGTTCAKPAETPAPSAIPTPEAVCEPMNDNIMKAGETYEVSGKEFIVQGDVLIDGVKYYDSNAKTGAIDIVLDSKTHTIKAPWGADVQVFEDCATDQFIQDTYSTDLEQLKATGRILDTKSLKQS